MSQMRSCALKKMVMPVPLSREWFGKNNSRQLHTRHHSFFGSNGAGSGRCFGGRQGGASLRQCRVASISASVARGLAPISQRGRRVLGDVKQTTVQEAR